MKKYALIISTLLMGFSLNAFGANWIFVAKTQNNDYFIDQSTLSGPLNNRNLEVKVNINGGEVAGTSTYLKEVINCETSEITLISTKRFSGLDLSGDAVPAAPTNLNVTRPIQPNTVGATYQKVACPTQQTAAPQPAPVAVPQPSAAPQPKVTTPQQPNTTSSSFATVAPQAPPTNFLLGKCKYVGTDGDPALTSCNPRDAASRYVMMTGIFAFNPSTYNFYIVPGSKPNPGGMKPQTMSFPITYQIVNPNTIITTYTTTSGCTMSEKYTLRSGSIYEQSISQSGTCGEDQRVAFDISKREGEKKSKFVF